ncbi:kinesin-like protein KIF16B isoform X2 [Nematostella vectensis]|uniref:kinesin-like protein KIF16B isoform X2 n=1 Tax=Nematostella vectensis TaxID=45351 RepID=UPI002076F932|nr:kinesin-like protein KIF16B isoform X2 [Nematostella vectensis]
MYPRQGPYVEGLTKQHVSDYDSIEVLIEQGNRLRATAATKMNEMSSRSHAIFTLKFTQARFFADLPSETISKIHLVDLAGSERASASGATGTRLKEGSNINKSLVTLGIVISTLAENSLNSYEHTKKLAYRKKLFVPYRDSVLTFLLKDSLGGNSKTIMIAAVSPAECNYGETLSTLRYAQRAKNIINKPTVNEDPNVKLIRELRYEIERLKNMLQENSGSQVHGADTTQATLKLHEKEAKVEQLTKDWTERWKEAKRIMQESQLALSRQGSCVLTVDLELPHLVRLEEDPLRTEIMLYRLMHGKTRLGREDASITQDIILSGEEIQSQHCVMDFTKGRVTVDPLASLCWVNGVAIVQPTKLNQGDVLVLGKSNVFKFNFPSEAAKLREQRKSGIFSSESVESLSHLSQIRGSHGDLSTRSDVSSPFTLDSGVELEVEGVDELKNNVSQLIAKHKEAEVRRMEVERNYRDEIDTKQREIEAMKEQMQQIRQTHEENAENVRNDLQGVQQCMVKRNEQENKHIDGQIEGLFEIRDDVSSTTEEEKETFRAFMEDEWRKIEQYEMKLADIELQKRKIMEKAEVDIHRQRELLSWEKDQEIRDLEEQQDKLIELQGQLTSSYSLTEKEYHNMKPVMEKTIKKEKEELEHIERKIRSLERKQLSYLKKEDIELAGEERDFYEEKSKSRNSSGCSKDDSGIGLKNVELSFDEKEVSSSLDSCEVERASEESVSPPSRKLSQLDSEIDRLIILRNEKTKSINDSQLALMEKQNNVDFYKEKILKTESKLTELEREQKETETNHLFKLDSYLESLREEEHSIIAGYDSERDKYINFLWDEYEQIETRLNEALHLTPDSEESGSAKEQELSSRGKDVLEILRRKLDRVSSDENELFLDYLAKRAKLERDEERVLEQERKISEEALGSQKEKELAIQKLTAVRDRFHVERERERKLIKSRLRRINRMKGTTDLQNEEAVEYLKEETSKLQEACEKVEEIETRLLAETREKEVLLLQLDEVRSNLLTSEEERDEMLTKLREIEQDKAEKEQRIKELKKIVQEEKNKYLENLTTEEYEVVQKPLVNRLHIRYRVIGNHAAAELMREAFLASSVPEIVHMFPDTGPPTPKDSNHGGWTFQHVQKEVAILRKREELPTGFIYCFMGRGIIETSPRTVWEAVRNPLSRYIYDNMLKKISIVEHVEEGLKVVYMLHETTQCFLTHSRDFCYVSKERVEGNKFVLASQSIDHERSPPVPGIIRAQIMSSGWIVEPIEINGRECSMVWYITKVHLGNTSLPWRLIDVLSKRQPLSIAYLRSYIAP